jgi:hypothetical protein
MAEQEKTAEKTETLTDAITKAVASQDKSDVVLEKEGEEKEEEQEEEKEPADKIEVDDEHVQGKAIVQILKDPNKASAFIDFLARQAGYSKGEIKTQADVKEAEADINKILERHLGQEFQFLVPKLGPALKEGLEALIESRDTNSDLRVRLERQELKSIESETAETHVSLAQEWFGSNDMPVEVVKEMSRAMDEFPPTDPNMSPERYYRRIFALAVGELGIQKGNKQKGDRTERNRSDSVARNLSSQNRGVTPSNNGGNPRKMSLKDAVSLAMEQVEQSSKK